MFTTIFWLFRIRYQKKWFWMLVLNFIIVSFLIQPTFITEMSEIFRCKELDKKMYVSSSLDCSCENETYINWRNYFFIPIICFWIFLFPLLCFWKLFKNSKNLDNPQIKLFFGFFYLGYQPEYYFWEIIIMYRKIFIIFISAIPEDFIKSKGYIILFLNSFATYLQKLKSPFIDKELNNLELKANYSSTLTIFFGLFYLVGISDQEKAVCFIGILIFNTIFLLSWLKFLFYVSFKTLSENWIIKKCCPSFPKKILAVIKGFESLIKKYLRLYKAIDNIRNLKSLKNFRNYMKTQNFFAEKELNEIKLQKIGIYGK